MEGAGGIKQRPFFMGVIDHYRHHVINLGTSILFLYPFAGFYKHKKTNQLVTEY